MALLDTTQKICHLDMDFLKWKNRDKVHIYSNDKHLTVEAQILLMLDSCLVVTDVGIFCSLADGDTQLE